MKGSSGYGEACFMEHMAWRLKQPLLGSCHDVVTALPQNHHMTLEKIKPGLFYSNGAYGRTWGVRQLANIHADAESGKTVYEFKGVAGTCRRKKGHCSPAEFARWAKYKVALLENDWKRIVDPDDVV